MSRYIDADALESKKFISWTCPEFFDDGAREQQAYQIGWNNAIEAVMENEPTADVVEVVRCKDCRYYEWMSNRVPNEQTWFCHNWNIETGKDDFCSYAERRKE